MWQSSKVTSNSLYVGNILDQGQIIKVLSFDLICIKSWQPLEHEWWEFLCIIRQWDSSAWVFRPIQSLWSSQTSEKSFIFSESWLCLVSCPCFIITKVWWKTLQHQRENKYFSAPLERFSNVYRPVWINQKLLINVKIRDKFDHHECERFNKYFDNTMY